MSGESLRQRPSLREWSWKALGARLYSGYRDGSQREGRLAGIRPAVELKSYRHTPMSVLAPAVGAVLAAILESSVLTHLQVGSVRPDLVFAVGVAVAMVLGFESGMTWAFVGGITLDLLLPGRALGSRR